MSVTIYVEGGGVGEASLSECRKGFRRFFERLLPEKDRVVVFPCGGRGEVIKVFKLALQTLKPGDYALLLVDSEGPVGIDVSPWAYLEAREEDKWERPEGANERDAHLMVQCMEAWFMADREAVVRHFDAGLKVSDLPAPVNGDIEPTAKGKIDLALNKAARRAKKARGTKKQGYDKVADGFTLLASIDPEKVRASSRHVRQLTKVLKEILSDRPKARPPF